MAKTATIITHDTLWAMGMATLVRENFGLHTSILRSMGQIDSALVDDTILFVTTAEIFLADLQFFLPKKDRVVLIGTRCPINVEGVTPLFINAETDESQIVNALTPLCKGDSAASTANKLTDREISVLKLVASGYINKEIADELNISINTVLSHRKNITAKLGIKSVSGLSVYAIMNGIITTPDQAR